MRFSVFVCLTVFLYQVKSLHFYLVEGKEKCVTDDIPGNTVFIGINLLVDF
jgi:hypothetical protein